MSISQKMQEFIEKASWIRKMFEEGAYLKQKYGTENVFDFSLGNPHLQPPSLFYQALKKEIEKSHSYTPNAGLLETREAIAAYLSQEHGIKFCADEIILTCGAAGALNVILKALLNPGDEVIVLAPFFVEYGFYIDNHGGIMKVVLTKDNFDLDLEAINKALNLKTKAILLNSPNNPTGQVYSEAVLKELAIILKEHKKKTKNIIYLIMDEPYRKIIYDGIKLPSIFKIYPETILATSFSKDLSLAGERIGYLAIHPNCTYKKELIEACILANRILGFVNAPVLMQRIIKHLLNTSVNIEFYKRNRDLLCKGLSDLGFSFILPKGAFYLFPKTPIPDDIAFVKALQTERILAVPGSGFGTPGYFRLAFCVEETVIKKAMPHFEKIANKFGLIS
ncbi:MAG TPA: pyridoxal phosphate-dependent aminotransferase [Candidatus Desulfofervidus auxilii]|uniref:Aminotransferase n=1 Tax=Desulfofervidus auxilii TaxID=1621989 RepID=A0A7C0U4N4_DESA2|nr:pyridoxal phosphate-dependent aminotransferase [Candidatus Desulfofervidus auxilii]